MCCIFFVHYCIVLCIFTITYITNTMTINCKAIITAAVGSYVRFNIVPYTHLFAWIQNICLHFYHFVYYTHYLKYMSLTGLYYHGVPYIIINKTTVLYYCFLFILCVHLCSKIRYKFYTIPQLLPDRPDIGLETQIFVYWLY